MRATVSQATRYAIAVTIETETPIPVYAEIRQRLPASGRAQLPESAPRIFANAHMSKARVWSTESPPAEETVTRRAVEFLLFDGFPKGSIFITQQPIY